jgi:hypothetical protein
MGQPVLRGTTKTYQRWTCPDLPFCQENSSAFCEVHARADKIFKSYHGSLEQPRIEKSY